METHPLNDDVVATLTEEQVTVLSELGELAAKKLQVSSQIEELSERISASQRHMGFQSKDDPGGLHEDPEVVELVTIRERYKLGSLTEQIRRALGRAVEQGLGDLAIIQRQCRIYGVDCKSEITSRRYFSDLSGKQKPNQSV